MSILKHFNNVKFTLALRFYCYKVVKLFLIKTSFIVFTTIYLSIGENHRVKMKYNAYGCGFFIDSPLEKE